MSDLTRRHFALMGALGFGAAACSSAEDVPPEVTTEDRIAAAEELLGVEFTEAERAQMAEGLAGGMDTLEALRAFQKDNALSPATVFDPRLPGVEYGLAGEGSVPPLPPMVDRRLSVSQMLGSNEDIAFASVERLRAALAGTDLTSERLTQIYLDRIAEHGDALECFVTVTPELAMEQAREADRRRAAGENGPLLGIPYAAKDLFDTEGILTTYGAEPFKDRVASKDAWVVERLREAGAVLLGKTTLGALAYGDIWFGGRTNNPWNPAEGSSGSSAGSASAVAAGLCAFALGTETLGSLVSPSTRCGTATLRPTFGMVPRTGAMALCWSMDKIGPIVRSAGDANLIMPTLTGTDAGDPSSLGGVYPPFVGSTGRKRVGYDPAWFEGADNAQLAGLEAMRGIANVVEVSDTLPDIPMGALSYILLAEAAAAFEMLTLDGRDDLLKWQDDAAWPNTFRGARFISGIDLVQAQRIRRLAMEHMHGVFEAVDALISPPFAGGLLQVTNYTGQPCVTVRAGFMDSASRSLFGDSAEGDAETFRVPTSLCLWGGLFRDADIVELGAQLENALEVAAERPAGFG